MYIYICLLDKSERIFQKVFQIWRFDSNFWPLRVEKEKKNCQYKAITTYLTQTATRVPKKKKCSIANHFVNYGCKFHASMFKNKFVNKSENFALLSGK